jgi:hypothetical protein
LDRHSFNVAANSLDRLVHATERIADALEFLVRGFASAGPQPRLIVARAPSDTSAMGPANLEQSGKLFVHVRNSGDADTTLLKPTVQLGETQVDGGIVDRSGQPQPSAAVMAGKDGPGVIVQFDLGIQAQRLAGLPLVLQLPHRPGRFPGVTVLDVVMESAGVAEGRPQWRQVDARERPVVNAGA